MRQFGSLSHRRLPKQYDPLRRLNTICPYYTMFPLEFPFGQLARAQPGDWVLDPFCGRGTTNFAARLLGLPSVGIDSNPAAVAIAASKFLKVQASDIVALSKLILGQKRQPYDVPQGRFWRLCYHPKTLEEICKLREELIHDCSTPERVALRALVLGILHGPRQKGAPSYLSNQMPRTYATKPKPAVAFWLKRRLYPFHIKVLDVVEKRARFSFSELPPEGSGFVLQADSRDIQRDQFSMRFRWVITSPPYLGMRTYVPDQWLRNWFLGGPATVAYPKNGQLGCYSEANFLTSLSEIWRRISQVCLPSARLIVRFGALPCLVRNPIQILKQSLEDAECGWRIRTIRKAGLASHGKRQAHQFGCSSEEAVEEIDLHSVLEA